MPHSLQTTTGNRPDSRRYVGLFFSSRRHVEVTAYHLQPPLLCVHSQGNGNIPSSRRGLATFKTNNTSSFTIKHQTNASKLTAPIDHIYFYDAFIKTTTSDLDASTVSTKCKKDWTKIAFVEFECWLSSTRTTVFLKSVIAVMKIKDMQQNRIPGGNPRTTPRLRTKR
jgi:hypothetical protein